MDNIINRRLVWGECFNITSTILSDIRNGVRVNVRVMSWPAWQYQSFWFRVHGKYIIRGYYIKGAWVRTRCNGKDVAAFKIYNVSYQINRGVIFTRPCWLFSAWLSDTMLEASTRYQNTNMYPWGLFLPFQIKIPWHTATFLPWIFMCGTMKIIIPYISCVCHFFVFSRCPKSLSELKARLGCSEFGCKF